jgi:hypothetical protein
MEQEHIGTFKLNSDKKMDTSQMESFILKNNYHYRNVIIQNAENIIIRKKRVENLNFLPFFILNPLYSMLYKVILSFVCNPD